MPSSPATPPHAKVDASPAALDVGRWTLDVGRSSASASPPAIAWTPAPGEAHEDHIEMSGEQISIIATYGVDAAGRCRVSRQVIWPMLRFHPNRTRDHLSLVFGEDSMPRVLIDQMLADTAVTRVTLDGLLRFEGALTHNGARQGIDFTRTIFPSTTLPIVFDTTELANRTDRELSIEIEANERQVRTNPTRGVYGVYLAGSRVVGAGEFKLKPGERLAFTVLIAARKEVDALKVDASPTEEGIDFAREERTRRARVAALVKNLVLETPDAVLNTAFAFAKIRTGESIFRTKGGLLHSPGGGPYYAAIWANDQAEYANPFFGYFGDALATEAALNGFRHFARHINPDYRPIPSAIIAEGGGFWHGAGDRGDMAMLAYGAGRFALALGDEKAARELWPLIEWCLEFCRRKVDASGVVASDSDELENRFPAGDANLCTSSLYYDALNSAVMLGRDLAKPGAQLADYAERAKRLREAIDRHFGATVEGFKTYRYYEGNTVLRSWICIPLTVGIDERAAGTIEALFSPRLWSADGLLTQAGDNTFWDRATLYGLRGALAGGAVEKAMEFLTDYSNRRLLGDHVPYPVEAYPEGNQRHLAAESALYCRVFVEGLLGLRPTGLRSFECRPRLPQAWPGMALRKVNAFGQTFDLVVTREGAGLRIEVLREGRAPLVRPVATNASAAFDLA